MTKKIINERAVDHEIDPIFPSRWSPRAMSGDEVSREELMRLFEAARWAPSSFNNQPWRFIYALRSSPNFEHFFGLLQEGNQAWAKKAAVLVIVASKNTFDHNGKPSRTHSFDAGAAWENLALQASRMKLVTHGMEGFDYNKAHEVGGIPQEGYTIEAMVAIGKPGNVKDLPEALQSKEHPNTRKTLKDFAFEDRLPTKKN